MMFLFNAITIMALKTYSVKVNPAPKPNPKPIVKQIQAEVHASPKKIISTKPKPRLTAPKKATENIPSLKGKYGIDYAWQKPDPDQIKNNKYVFVCRYLSNNPSKNLSSAEMKSLRDRGIKIVVVWETGATSALSGYQSGQLDAKKALAQANSLGIPKNAVIYFAVDFDASNSLSKIEPYLTGAASIVGKDRMGVYGGYDTVKYSLDKKIATYAWQAYAWSRGRIDPRAHIYQSLQTAFNGGADINQARQSSIGAF